MNKTAKGTAFEIEVQTLLRLLGYTLTHNNLVNGTQIDLLAKNTDPLSNHTFLVECTDREPPVSVGLVKEKAATLLSLRGEPTTYRLLFVSKSGFTAEAKAFAASQSNLSLFSINELEALLLNLDPYSDAFIYAFEKSKGIYAEANLIANYVELRGRDQKGVEIPSLQKYARKWLDDKDNNLLFLLGDYGAGKSSFSRTWTYKLLVEKYRQNRDQKYTPILINLKDTRGRLDLKSNVMTTLGSAYGVKISNFSSFERLCSSGNVLLILDGFDEMSDKSDMQTLVECFSEIYVFAALKTKILLTCRSNFFKSHSDVIKLIKSFSINTVSSLDESQIDIKLGDQGVIAYVDKLNINQIREYIQKRMGSKSERMLETIAKIHDLSDLSSRPVLLDMIVSTLPKLEKSKTRINSASLYDLYTDRWTTRDQWRAKLPRDLRRSFCELLAWEMHCAEKLNITVGQLQSIVTAGLKDVADSKDQLEKFKNDIQTCSFLVRDGDGDKFRFAHKSFLEFFVALRLVANLNEGMAIRKANSDILKTENSFISSIQMIQYSTETPTFALKDYIVDTIGDRLKQSSMYMDLQKLEVMGRWSSLSPTITLEAHLESHIKTSFAKYSQQTPSNFSLSEEIATFAMEILYNRKINAQKVLELTKDENSILILSDIVRQAKPSDWLKENLSSLKGYIKDGKSAVLRIAFLTAVFHHPDLVDIKLLFDARQYLPEEGWSYVLFEVLSVPAISKQVLDSLLQLEDLSPVDQVLLIRALSQQGREINEWSSRIPDLLKVLLSSKKEVERILATSVVSLLPNNKRVAAIARAFAKVNSKETKHELMTFLQQIGDSDSWKQLRILAAKETNPEVKAALHAAELAVRNASSNLKNRSRWKHNESKGLRDRMWSGLNRPI